jgi:signal transduction histidine kinase/CheY-like chemotaxis protein
VKVPRASTAALLWAVPAAAALMGAAVCAGWRAASLAAAALLASLACLGYRQLRRCMDRDAAARHALEEVVAERTAAMERQRQEMADQLRRLETAHAHLGATDRLAAVGRLAAGVAHEVNTPLAIALTNVAWLREALPAEGAVASRKEIAAALADADQAVQRIARIVRDLQDFAQDGPRAPGAADLVGVLNQVERLVAHTVRARARFTVDLPAPSLLVAGSPSRLGQLFVHLLLHAVHSVEEGRPDAHEVRVEARRADGGAVVEVRDTGRGLDADEVAHVFDPFHHSWSTGAGHGLGLAACHGIAGTLGGAIDITSAPGQGSRYRVRLPLAGPGVRLALREAPAARARHRVLVVDDEPLACASLYRTLSRSFDVVPHTSPRHALGVVKAGERFDAVLCDLMMPEMSGADFHRELLRLDAGLADRVVFLTGGAFTDGAREFLEQVQSPRLHKPFEPRQLIALIASRCDRALPAAPPTS